MSDIIRFTTDEPEEIRLKYPDGKEVDGRFGPQVMFSTDDGRLFFVDPPVAAKIHALRLQPGEGIVISKRAVKDGRKSAIRWEVTRAAQAQAQQRTEAVGQTVATPAPIVVSPRNEEDASTTPTILARSLASALIASIDAIRMAADYAKSKGLASDIHIDFNAEDVRTLANAAMIQMQKEMEFTMRYRTSPAVPANGHANGSGSSNGHVNGGAAWPRQ